mmetsp:Transcript_41463/g.69270  ORF Transcript_41463/g.69270 Transcript_41463/m.69270 type:complete len:365 (-) Transcript_41463:146-1240(-)
MRSSFYRLLHPQLLVLFLSTMARDTPLEENKQADIPEPQHKNRAGLSLHPPSSSSGLFKLRKLMALMRLRGGDRGTLVPKRFRSTEAVRELKMRLRDRERDLYAEPGGHVGNMLEKSLLPNLDVANPCYKLTIRQDRRVIGTCVIEMFGPYVPSEIAYIHTHSRNWKITRLRQNMLIEMQYDGPPITPSDDMSNLEHSEPYLLTMKRGEAKPTLRLTYLTTHSMDKSHQVVGRVLKGIEVFDTIANLELYLDPNVEGWKQPASDVVGSFETTRHPLADSMTSGYRRVGEEENGGDSEEEEEEEGNEKDNEDLTNGRKRPPGGAHDDDQMEEKMPRISASDFMGKQSSSVEDSDDEESGSKDGDA